jgi:levanase/levanbiose-producing levanase
VGGFDGVRFLPDAGSLAAPEGLASIPDPAAASAALRQCLWLDWGRDCYASVSFSNAPDGRRIIIGWMNNWDYANELPTGPWRSSMTLARELRLTAVDGSARLVQQPVLPEPHVREEPVAGAWISQAGPVELRSEALRLPDAVPGRAQVIEAEILAGTADRIAFRIFGSSDGTAGTILSYNPATAQLSLDRRQSGNTGFHGKFASIESAPLVLEDGLLKLQIVVDHCSVEVFAQGGKVVLTDLVFPEAEHLHAWLSAEGGPATVLNLAVSTLT